MPNHPEDQSFVRDDTAIEGEDQPERKLPAGEGAPEADTDGAGGNGTEAAGDEHGQQYVETLQAELEAARQRTLRLQAELENYRKRAQRTLDEERRYADLPLMRDLLPVVDNLQRALEAAQQNEGAAGLLEGVTMVAQQLGNVLKQHHCEEIPAAGARFDPHLHEAIMQVPSDECAPGEVVQVTQVGYQLHDRVIRPSQVIVAAAGPDAD